MAPDITAYLKRWAAGDRNAQEIVVAALYDELHRRAELLFSGEATSHTLQPTALLSEACVNLLGADVHWNDRNHFLAVASKVMRRILVDHARARRAQKRGAGAAHVELDEAAVRIEKYDASLVRLSDALADLEKLDERKASLIEMKYFGGLSTEEMASVTGVSVATVGRELRYARAWLLAQLGANQP